MITNTLVTSTSTTVPELVFTSSTTGGAVGGGVLGQINAVTTIALCNIATPNLTDETTNQVVANIYFAKQGQGAQNRNLIVSNLTIPAGETVFFSEERIVLDAGDEIYVGTTRSGTGQLAVTVSTLPV